MPTLAGLPVETAKHYSNHSDYTHLQALIDEFGYLEYDTYIDTSDNLYSVHNNLTSDMAICFDDYLRCFVKTFPEGEVVTFFNLKPRARFLLHTLARRYQLKHKSLKPDKPELNFGEYRVYGQKFNTITNRYDMEISNPSNTTVDMLEEKKSLRELFGMRKAKQKKPAKPSLSSHKVVAPCSDKLPNLPNLCHIASFLSMEDALTCTQVDKHWNESLNSSAIFWKEQFARWVSQRPSPKAVAPKTPQTLRSVQFWNDYDSFWNKGIPTRNEFDTYYMNWLEDKSAMNAPDDKEKATFWKRQCCAICGCNACDMPFRHVHGFDSKPSAAGSLCSAMIDLKENTSLLETVYEVFRKAVLAVDDTVNLASFSQFSPTTCVRHCHHATHRSWNGNRDYCHCNDHLGDFSFATSRFLGGLSGQPVPMSAEEFADAIVQAIGKDNPILCDVWISDCSGRQDRSVIICRVHPSTKICWDRKSIFKGTAASFGQAFDKAKLVTTTGKWNI